MLPAPPDTLLLADARAEAPLPEVIDHVAVARLYGACRTATGARGCQVSMPGSRRSS